MRGGVSKGKLKKKNPKKNSKLYSLRDVRVVGHHQRDPQQPRVGDRREDHHPGGAHVNHVGPARDQAREHAEADAKREKQRRRLVEGQPFEGF